MTNQDFQLSEHGIRLYESNHNDGDLVNEHYHEIHQVLYALKGEGKVALDGKTSSFRQDNVAIITPFTSHSISSDSSLTVLVLAFDKNILENSLQKELLGRYFNETALQELNLFDGSNVRQLLRRMLYEQSHGESINYVALKIFLSELLLKLARSQEQLLELDANTLRAERLRQYIDTHYFEILGSNDLAAKLGISTRHINTIFKEKYNITPVQYLTEVRLGLAEKMLINTDSDIASICFEVGFESLSTFYRLFKNSRNISPNRYRKAHQMQN